MKTYSPLSKNIFVLSIFIAALVVGSTVTSSLTAQEAPPPDDLYDVYGGTSVPSQTGSPPKTVDADEQSEFDQSYYVEKRRLLRIQQKEAFSPTPTFSQREGQSSAQKPALAAAKPQVGANQCVGNGLQVCRCYCRVDLTKCENNQRSNVSFPLCPLPWVNAECSSIGYFHTRASDAARCAALNDTPCEGYIRPDRDTPAGLAGQKVGGSFLACSIVALESR